MKGKGTSRANPPVLSRPVLILLMGDIHGRLNKAVRLIRQVESDAGTAVDFVLQVGDLEAHRHPRDLVSMYAPFRDKQLGDFRHYIDGGQRFPRPLYFIGGNHEPYGRLEESPGGSTLAENIHYLGRAGTVDIKGLKITFLSGIYHPHFFREKRDRLETRIGGDDWIAQLKMSCYRLEEIDRLCNGGKPHLLLIHEWPYGLVRWEDHEEGQPRHRKLRYGETGIPLIREIIKKTGPQLAVCGHLHRRYSGWIPNGSGDGTRVECLGHIDAGLEACRLYCFDGRRLEAYQP